jgi:hypothetical protein
MRLCTSRRLSRDTTVAAYTGSHGSLVTDRASRYTAATTTTPATMLGSRQPSGSSPKSRIEPAIRTLPSGGCSVFGSRPAGESAYGSPSGTARSRIRRAALT